MSASIERAADGRLSTLAAAKVNLGLRITGRRDNGYHELMSRFAFADIGDVVTAAPADTISLTITGPFATGLDPERNSLVDAARALAMACGIGAGAALTLEKNLPVASGIGGGSADAAATLRLLCELWTIRPANLMEIAEKLGADVPSCIEARPCLVTGIGEKLDFIAAPRSIPALLVNPNEPVSTPEVFQAYRNAGLPFSEPSDALDGQNDLVGPALMLCPEIGDVLGALGETEAEMFNMSGSGATCYGLFATKKAADDAAASLSAAHPRWWVRACVLSV